jgi:nucleoid-associated protein YgaU
MPNDAKLGLVVGVVVVIAVAVVFFRKDAVTARPAAEAAATAVPGAAPPAAAPRGQYRTLRARTATRIEDVPARGQRHIVKEGDTLFTLAQFYYKDGNKFVDIYRANQEVLKTPDPLVPGTVLIIPDLPDPTASAELP